eukprot:351415_1
MIPANRMFRLRRGIPQCRTVLSQCRLAHKHAPLTNVSRVATRPKSDTPSLTSDSKPASALPNQASFVRNPTEPPIPSPPNGKSDVSKDPQNPCRSEPKTSSGPQHKTSPEPRIPDTRETESEAPKADLSSSKSSPKEPNMGVSGDPKGTKSSQKEQNQGVSEERKGTKSSPKEQNLNISEEPNGSTIDGGGPMDFRDLFTFQNALFMSRVTVLDSNITLPPFLNSAKFVYRAITDLMFREDSAQLEEMVSPELMAKMRQNFHSTSTSETALPPTKSRMEIQNLLRELKPPESNSRKIFRLKTGWILRVDWMPKLTWSSCMTPLSPCMISAVAHHSQKVVVRHSQPHSVSITWPCTRSVRLWDTSTNRPKSELSRSDGVRYSEFAS